MSVKFFGQFLLERGKVLREELLDAMRFQKEVNVKLGTIALDAGYLTAEQIETTYRRQQETDKLFGEIAVELNFITQEQLEELLQIQKNERMSLGEALVQKGYLTLGDLEQELAEFKKSQEGVLEKAYLAVKQAKTSVIPETFLDSTIKLFRRMVDIDLQIISSHTDRDRIAPNLWNIYQNFHGDTKGIFVVSLPEPIFLVLASHVAQEKVWDIDEFAKDGVQEFINVVVGNTASKLSIQGIHLSLEPPKIITSLGHIKIPEESTETVAVKLGSPEYGLEDQNLQISIIYSPISNS